MFDIFGIKKRKHIKEVQKDRYKRYLSYMRECDEVSERLNNVIAYLDSHGMMDEGYVDKMKEYVELNTKFNSMALHMPWFEDLCANSQEWLNAEDLKH